jgi:FemAB-related protein (PEP-CTERM system-associated)
MSDGRLSRALSRVKITFDAGHAVAPYTFGTCLREQVVRRARSGRRGMAIARSRDSQHSRTRAIATACSDGRRGASARSVCAALFLRMELAYATRSYVALTVRPYRGTDRSAWTRFVQSCPEASFFHRIEWRDLLEDFFRHRAHYLVAERGEHIVGVLPLAEVKSLVFGHALVSLPFAEHAGVAVSDPAAVAPLHAAARDLAMSLGVQHLELRNLTRREPEWPEQDLYVSFRKPISRNEEDNVRAVSKNRRQMARRAVKRGLTVEFDADTRRFFQLYSDSMQRHGTPPFPRRYFDELLRVFGRDAEVMTVVDHRGRPLSTVLSFYFRDESLPYYGGDVAAAREVDANDFRVWELIRRAWQRRVRLLDLGRSKRGTGAYEFKHHWGFTPHPLHYEYALLKRDSVPQNNPTNPKFSAPIAVWKRLPRPVVNWLGPHIVRFLG